MNANEFMQHLKHLCACSDAKKWACGKSWQEVYDTCHRGDWLFWLYRRSKGYDFQKLTLAKGLCANTVRHLIADEQSLILIDAAISFGRGEISKEELDATAYGADAAADAATAYAYAYAARKENQQKTADIVRDVLPFEIWEL